ncbi:MAG TPA: fatty acid desaturase [Myxococcaceae bacterium]|nr:fatty acid desaturase [Myxococcaceae bacterium]
MPVVALLPYVRPELAVWLSPLACYLALSAGVIAHNHNHTPTFRGRGLNAAFGNWLSIFYGYPTFAWVPTHNLNHHKFVNKAGDATITWRFTNKHNALVAGTYFFVSSWYQSDPIRDYIQKAKEKNPQLYRTIQGQYALFGGVHVGLFALAIVLHGWRTGFIVWSLMFLLPALFALWTIMFFNYIQHVHTDPWSEHDHSRSFVSPVLNFLLFNNGYHSAHHELAGAHWSTLPALHARLAPSINPVLNERSFWWFCLRNYLLALAFPSLGTKQIGRAPFDDPGLESSATPVTAEVDAFESGVNAARA